MRLGIFLQRLAFFVIFFYKIDLFCQEIISIISTASNKICMITSFNNLFTQFPKANHQLLFINYTKTFNCNYYITKKFQKGVCALSYEGNYTGHLFKRKAITSARLAQLLKDKIQLLGKWKSNYYCLYIKTHFNWIYNASQRH